jgi:undecaprenyl-diphosphatase
MTLSEVGILALVQGLTEFLPISSSGHLVVARWLFGISDVEGSALDAFLHLGTLLALLTYYWRFWRDAGRSVLTASTGDSNNRRLLGLIMLVSLPAVAVGLLWSEQWDVALRSPRSVAWQLALTAVILLLTDYLPQTTRLATHLTSAQVLFIGVAQAIALIPGISRSGITIAAGRAVGLSRSEAVRFSFLMAVPVLAGAGALSIPAVLEAHQWPVSQLVIGLIVSWVSGLAAIAGLVKLVERTSLRPFVWYLLVIAALVWIYG